MTASRTPRSNCPSCGSTRVYPSRVRSPFERLRRYFSEKRPYRCHRCNWRGWEAHGWDPVSEEAEDLEWPPGTKEAPPLAPEELDTLDKRLPPLPETHRPPPQTSSGRQRR